MSFFFSVIIRLKCYNFTVSIASIDHFDFVKYVDIWNVNCVCV